jgi:regulator of protease activity HflC (stomatin/prohibitin superfamily)
MPDPDDNDLPGGATGGGAGSQPNQGTRITWRGIVDDETEAARARKHPIRTGIGRAASAGLVAVGLKRGRNDDGTPADRHTGRLLAIVGVFVAVLLVFSMLHIVPAGTVLVPVTLGDAQTAETQGLHVTLPWPLTRVTSMSVRVQNYTMAAANIRGTDKPVIVLGSDGASGTVDATVLYRLNPHRASDVYTNIGVNFGTVLVQPTSRKCIRDNFANYPMVQAATTAFKALGDQISDCISHTIEPQGIDLVEFQLRQVVLSTSLSAAVNQKVAAQQAALAQLFNEQAAELGADITRINAKAQSDAQIIVACGGTAKTEKRNGIDVAIVTPNPTGLCQADKLTSNELTYQYIQAIRDLINSKNNVTVILQNPNGNNPITLPAGGSTSSTTTGK